MTPSPHLKIICDYAKWTALSAARVPKAPIKDRKTVYQLLAGADQADGRHVDGVAFAKILSGKTKIDADEFNVWHECETDALCRRADEFKPGVAPFPVGWSAKLINVYLKTTAYVGTIGRPGLRNVLHPPLDRILQRELMRHFRKRDRSDMLAKVNFGAIKSITCYERYREVIEGCAAAADDLDCLLIEVDQLWRP